MFNKTYQTRSRTGGDLESVGEILQNVLRHTDPDGRFYRPERQTPPGKHRRHGPGKLKGVQLELNFEAPVSQKCYIPDPQQPLFDLFPEAYQPTRAGTME